MVNPSPLELEILHVLWKSAPLTVKAVRDELEADGRILTHSSVITVMNILVRKGFLLRKKEGRSLVFWPKRSKDSVTGKILKELYRKTFESSASSLVLGLIEAADLNKDELKAIRDLINQKVRTM